MVFDSRFEREGFAWLEFCIVFVLVLFTFCFDGCYNIEVLLWGFVFNMGLALLGVLCVVIWFAGFTGLFRFVVFGFSFGSGAGVLHLASVLLGLVCDLGLQLIPFACCLLVALWFVFS